MREKSRGTQERERGREREREVTNQGEKEEAIEVSR